MALVALGVDHHSAPLAERERFSYAPSELPRALPRLRHFAQLDECVLLSTCNRTEVYGIGRDLAGAFDRLQDFLAGDRQLDAPLVVTRVQRRHDDAAVTHLFRVAAGLESMVLGEGQVLGQVRAGFSAARRARTLGPELEALGRHALACGKRARAETAIARAPVSFAQAAVTLARQQHPDLDLTHVLVIGAGTMAASAISWFTRAGAGRVAVVSRTLSRAQAVAGRHGAQAFPLAALEARLSECDVVVVSAAAAQPVLTSAMFPAQRTRAMCVIDMGVPHGVEHAVAALVGVRLFNLDDLQRVVAAARGARSQEVVAVERIVEEEAARYLAWQRARHVAPTIAELNARGEAVRRGEWQRLRRELGTLSPAQERAIARLSRAIVNKLLHAPIIRLKEYAQDRHGAAYVDTVRNLYGLDLPHSATEAAEGRPTKARAFRQ